MKVFEKLNGVVAAIDRSNIDTDVIIPKQYLKSIKRSGFGSNLFDDWRYLNSGEAGKDNTARCLNPDFVLNKEPYKAASILLVRENFGCGSSREHAVWALMDFGIQAVIAPSYADIFYNNSFKNGLLPIILSTEQVDALFSIWKTVKDFRLDIDLQRKVVTDPTGAEMPFEVDTFHQYCLLNGLDDIGLTLQHIDQIKQFEQNYYLKYPWLGAV